MTKCWTSVVFFCISICSLCIGCPKNRFQCKKGGCTLESSVCNKRVDCKDGSDEEVSLCQAPLEIRLVDGNDGASGRVEVKFLGNWGTICGTMVDENVGKVICNSLGFKGPFSVHTSGFYGAGNGKIWISGLKCNGSESNIAECKHSPWGMPQCKHNVDLAVSCSSKKSSKLEAPVVCGIGRKSAIGKNYNFDLPQSSFININQPSTISKKMLPPNRHEPLGALIRKYRMVHAQPVNSLSNFPWIAEVRFLSSGISNHHCGAAILSEYFVLTAAHCVNDLRVKDYMIRVGEYDQDVKDRFEEDFEIAVIAIHKKFSDGTLLNNDIAIIRILPKAGHGIRFSKHVQPVCLPSVSAPYFPKLEAVTAGWGVTENGNRSKSLRIAQVPLIHQGACKYFTKYGDKLITPSMICAGHLEGGTDACDSDSGGPLVVKVNGRFTLYGIISWGFSCGVSKQPGVYTNIQYHLRWIIEHVNGLSH